MPGVCTQRCRLAQRSSTAITAADARKAAPTASPSPKCSRMHGSYSHELGLRRENPWAVPVTAPQTATGNDAKAFQKVVFR